LKLSIDNKHLLRAAWISLSLVELRHFSLNLQISRRSIIQRGLDRRRNVLYVFHLEQLASVLVWFDGLAQAKSVGECFRARWYW